MSLYRSPTEAAIIESREARIISRPNPWVGAVIVPEGTQNDSRGWILGHTQRYGGDHAEVVVIRKARELLDKTSLAKSTLYVTLEPCNHFGKTPPCTELIIETEIKKVVIGIVDPDTRVSGSGVQRLIDAGMEVEFFESSSRASVIVELLPYLWHKKNNKPFVVLKLAATLDGKIATSRGDSKWISSEISRKYVHRMRSLSDAIVVGANTVRADDPELTVRYGCDKEILSQPVRIVFGDVAKDNKINPCMTFKGDVNAFFDYFAGYNFQQILLEGGSGVARQFLDEGMINQVVLFMAPRIYGGQDGYSLFSGKGPDSIKSLEKGSFESVEKVGDDIKINYHTQDTVKFINLINELTWNVGMKFK